MNNVIFLRGGTYEERAEWAEKWVEAKVKRVRVDIRKTAGFLHPGKESQIDEIVIACSCSAMLTALKAGHDVCVVNDINYLQRDAFMAYRARKAFAKVIYKDFSK